MAREKLKALAGRLNGLSTPWFGLNWSPPESQREVAKRVLAMLEDRRVLYAQHAWEVPDHCAQSAIEIRRALSTELGKLESTAEIAGSLRALRAACRKFLDAMHVAGQGGPRIRHDDRDFLTALGELRGVFGVHVAIIAERFDVPVERELASTLPLVDDPNEPHKLGDLRRGNP